VWAYHPIVTSFKKYSGFLKLIKTEPFIYFRGLLLNKMDDKPTTKKAALPLYVFDDTKQDCNNLKLYANL